MGAAISLLMPLMPPDGALESNEGDGGTEGQDFFSALELELATLPPESRPKSEGKAFGETGAPPEEIEAAASAPALDEEADLDAELPLAIAARGAETRGTSPANPRAAAPEAPSRLVDTATPGARTANGPAAEAAPQPTPTEATPRPTAPAQTETAEVPTAPTAEAPAPPARAEKTRHADLRTQIRSEPRVPSEAPVDASARAVHAPAESEASAPPASQAQTQLQAPAPAPAPAIEGPAVSPSPLAPPSLQGAAPTGEAGRAPFGSPPVPPEGLPVQVEWLAERGGGRARVQLHPPHLGHVELEVRTRGGEVEVVLNVGEAAAHAPLQAQRTALTQALANHDLELSSFEVMDRNAGERRSPQQGSQSPPEQGASDSTRPSRTAAPETRLAHDAQRASTSRSTGVDVRI